MLKYTKKEVVEEIKRITEMLGRVPTKKEFLKYSEIGEYYLAMYGGLNQMIIEAGYEPRVHRKMKDTKRYSRDDLILAAMITYEEHPSWSTSKIIRNTSIPYYYFRIEFSNIDEINELIGRKPYGKIRAAAKFSDRELREKFLVIASKYPEENSVWKLLNYSEDCAPNTFYKRFSAAEMREMLRKIRARQNSPFLKRYPVKYNAMPVILKWAYQRPDRPKAV